MTSTCMDYASEMAALTIIGSRKQARTADMVVGESRKRDELGVPGPAVRSDVILCESLLCVDPSSFIKVDLSTLHDLLHFGLCSLIQASPRIPISKICSNVEL